MSIWWIVAAVIGVLLISVAVSYNRFVSQRTLVRNAWSNIDTELKRRYDLIPNLVATVKGYAAHEKDILEAVARARAGAVLATGLWIAGSAAFSLSVEKFATYNKTYGSLGAVVVLLMWFWLSAYAVLIGAELNAEMEHQTARDTTDLPKKPMGRRGAYVADTVAPPG